AQGDAAGGIPPFSTQLGGVYDLVDAASSRILVTVPVRSKNGKIPFPFRLVGNFHATVLCCNQGWGVTSYLQATPLAADLGVYTTSNTNLATRSGTCGSGYYAGFWLVDALGGFHPVNCTGQTSDGSGYTLGQQSGPGGVFPIWDKAGNKQTQQVQTGTLNSLTSVAVADPDGASVTEAFNPAWTPDGSSRGNGYSSGTITYTD